MTNMRRICVYYYVGK